MLILIPLISIGHPVPAHAKATATTTYTRSDNYHVSPESGCNGVPLADFRIRVSPDEKTDYKVTKIHLVFDPYSTARPRTLHFSSAGSMLSSAVVPAEPYEMDMRTEYFVKKGTELAFSVKGSFSSDTKNGTAFSARVSTVTLEAQDGTQKTIPVQRSSEPPFHRFYTKGSARWTLGSAAISDVKNERGETVSRIANFTFTLQAIGGDIEAPTNSDFKIIATNGTLRIPCICSTALSPNMPVVPEMSIITVKASAFLPKSTILQYLQTQFAVTEIKWKQAGEGGMEIAQDWGLEQCTTMFKGK